MAIVRKRVFSESMMTTPDSLLEFLTSMGVTATVSDMTITITLSDSFQITVLVQKTGYWNFHTSVVVNGTSTVVSEPARGCTAICVYGEGIFYLTFTDSGYDLRRFIGFYEQIEGNEYYAYSSVGGTGVYSINNLSMARIGGGNGYGHRALLNYAMPLDSINYINDFLCLGSAIEAPDPNTICCTTVSVGDVITMDGSNYFSLGSNTLVLMDD